MLLQFEIKVNIISEIKIPGWINLIIITLKYKLSVLNTNIFKLFIIQNIIW